MIGRPYTLIKAARASDLKTVQQLLAIKKTDINEQDSNGTTALMAAADGNHAHVVNALLLWRADINMIDGNRMTALMIAAKKGYSEVVYQLVRASTEAVGWVSTALSLAVHAGHVNVVQILLTYGGKNLDEIFGGISELEYAAGNNNLDMVRTFLMYRPNIYMTPAIEAAIDGDHVDMALLFASNEADPGNVLYIAATKGNEKMVRSLLANHVKIDAEKGIGDSALIAASESGHLNIVKLLLAHPEASNHTDASKQEAFMRAVKMKHLSIAHALLISGAKINFADSLGFTALMLAISTSTEEDAISSEVIRELLIWGPDIYLKNIHGDNALEYAEEFHPFILQLITNHIGEQKKYVGVKSEMESFFRGITVNLNATKTTFFLPAPLVNIIDEYASPTIKKTRTS